jgi:HPt (histidine-containing phosphotransfer) domain-containing protein
MRYLSHMYAEENSPGLTLQHAGELPAPVQPGSEDLGAVDQEVLSFLQQTLDARVLARIYWEFLERTRGRIDGLATLDRAGLREFAHTVSGTAGMLGATALAVYAGAAGALEPCSRELEQLARMLEGACEHLESQLRRQRVAL